MTTEWGWPPKADCHDDDCRTSVCQDDEHCYPDGYVSYTLDEDDFMRVEFHESAANHKEGPQNAE